MAAAVGGGGARSTCKPTTFMLLGWPEKGMRQGNELHLHWEEERKDWAEG